MDPYGTIHSNKKRFHYSPSIFQNRGLPRPLSFTHRIHVDRLDIRFPALGLLRSRLASWTPQRLFSIFYPLFWAFGTPKSSTLLIFERRIILPEVHHVTGNRPQSYCHWSTEKSSSSNILCLKPP